MVGEVVAQLEVEALAEVAQQFVWEVGEVRPGDDREVFEDGGVVVGFRRLRCEVGELVCRGLGLAGEEGVAGP